MKHLKFLIIAAIATLTSCATSDNVIKDDAYYSPYDKDPKNGKELVVSNTGTFNTAKITNKPYKANKQRHFLFRHHLQYSQPPSLHVIIPFSFMSANSLSKSARRN